MYTHIQKWGNSLGVRIPVSLSQQLKLKAGSPVEVTIDKNCLMILPKKYCLQEMLAMITEENLHSQNFSDSLKGKEEW